jgi:hypothetical protein
VYDTEHGTVTVHADGRITYKPDEDFSGTETFTYVTRNDQGVDVATDATMTVLPVSDAPTVAVENDSVLTNEDEYVALGLKAPQIVDDTDENGAEPGDWPERLGEITLFGFPPGATLKWNLDGGGAQTHVVGVDGKVTIVLEDVPSVAGTTADLTMSTAEFESLEVLPPEDRHENFTVQMTVSSFEVDGDGNVYEIDGVAVPGAESAISVEVQVQAVTDDIDLSFNGDTDANGDGTDDVTFDPGDPAKAATVTLAEDTQFDLRDILQATFVADWDGSERRWITIKNNTGYSIQIGGATLKSGEESNPIDATGQGGIGDFPPILIGGVENFSGVLNGIEVILHAQDRDNDGPNAVGTELTSSVTLNLRVTPVAGDVAFTQPTVTTLEDTAVAFLQNLKVTDASPPGEGGGNEVITKVAFTLPAGWTLTAQPAADPAVWSLEDQGGGAYAITFSSDDESKVENVLADFKITPPAHSSADAEIVVKVSTKDTNPDTGVNEVTDIELPVIVVVTPVAEQIIDDPNGPNDQPVSDTDGNGTPDLTMNPSHEYADHGEEDMWFALGSNKTDAVGNGWAGLGSFWHNEDAGEKTYARLTPKLIAGDEGEVDATGSQFRYYDTEAGQWQVKTYHGPGTTIDVPVQYLDSLQFKAAPDFAGKFEIEVRAVTVDTDDGVLAGDPTTSTFVSDVVTVLTNVIIEPKADPVTVSLNGRAMGLEDTEIPLDIRPRSSDPSETFRITITNIPDGAVFKYDGQAYAADSVDHPLVADPEHPGQWMIVIDDFDPAKAPSIVPPPHSNVDFTLFVKAATVDTVEIDGVTYTDVNDVAQPLSIKVSVKGVADEVQFTLDTPTYTEAALEAAGGVVPFGDLVPSSSQIDADGSEKLTLRITRPARRVPSRGGHVDRRHQDRRRTCLGADLRAVRRQGHRGAGELQRHGHLPGDLRHHGNRR